MYLSELRETGSVHHPKLIYFVRYFSLFFSSFLFTVDPPHCVIALPGEGNWTKREEEEEEVQRKKK